MKMLLQLIVSGMLLGGIYALLSVGLSLMLGVSKFIHFAHGDVVMAGMYMAYGCYLLFGLNAYFSWPIVLLMAVALGVVIYAFAHFTIGKSDLNQVLFTMGLSMILQNTALLMFKSDFKSVPSTFSSGLQVGGIYIAISSLITFVIAMLATAAFLVFIHYSSTGRAMRAVGDDRNAAMLVGIPVGTIDLITFCVGTGMACLSGGLLMSIYPTTPTLGSGYNLIAWVTVVLGGLGHLQGALMSAMLIGICETTSGFYLGADLRQVVYFAMFVAVLVFKPEGLFSGVNMKKVKRS
ncbi:MAG: branched-chain amino acid ABC transporter permease [Synergistaceae bacterium]|nr:branched-chain amino acid ABC transporter permease [Synergistaceae bacterium]